MDVLTTINGFYPSLTKAERKIAQYVLVNSEDVQHLSIGDLAAKAQVAETTVIRFCRKLRFKGFQDFKLQLARDLAVISVNQETPDDKDELPTSEYVEYLKRLQKAILPEHLAAVAKAIDQAHAVCIFGAGISAMVGNYFKTRLTRMGVAVIFDPDIHLQAIDIALLQADDVVVAISNTGNTRDLLQNVAIAKRFGVDIIAITNYLNTKLTQASDFTLAPPAGSGRDSSDFLPVLGQLTIIDLICQQLRELNPKRTQLLKDRINDALINRVD